MPVQIPDFLGRPDKEFGYNDYLITFEKDSDGSLFPLPTDNLTPQALSRAKEKDVEPENPEEFLKQWGQLKPGDQLFRYGGQSAYILRRSIFTDFVPSQNVRSSNVMPLNENLARALAYFSDTGFADAEWGRVTDAESSDNLVMTPWDLSTVHDIATVEKLIQKIKNAKSPDFKGSDLSVKFASKVSDAELDKLLSYVKEKKVLLEGDGWLERLIEKFGMLELGVAVAAFHYGPKLLNWLDNQVARYVPLLPQLIKSLAPTALIEKLLYATTPRMIQSALANRVLASPLALELVTSPTASTVGTSASRVFNGMLAVAALDWGYGQLFEESDYESSLRVRVTDRLYEENVYELDGWDFAVAPLALKGLRAGCRWLAPTMMEAAVTYDHPEIRKAIIAEDKANSEKIQTWMREVLPLLEDTNSTDKYHLLRGESDELPPINWVSRTYFRHLLSGGLEQAKQLLGTDDHGILRLVRRLHRQQFLESIRTLYAIELPVNDWVRRVFDVSGFLKPDSDELLNEYLAGNIKLIKSSGTPITLISDETDEGLNPNQEAESDIVDLQVLGSLNLLAPSRPLASPLAFR